MSNSVNGVNVILTFLDLERSQGEARQMAQEQPSAKVRSMYRHVMYVCTLHVHVPEVRW